MILDKNKLGYLDFRKYIIIKGAKVNNLKNLDIAIPRNKFVVITGLSGSGKSSLAIDTIFAEGHRMYLESLSSYARQFLGKIEKPKVEYIKGLSPAIAIQQRTISNNPRSTVGTASEIYDYLKILYSRIGKTYSPISNSIVRKDTPESILEYIKKLKQGSKVLLMFTKKAEPVELEPILKLELTKGFTRIVHNNQIIEIEELLENPKTIPHEYEIKILVDRYIINNIDEDYLNPEINDSKKLSAKKRHELSTIIKKSCIAWSIGISDNKEIDIYNPQRSSHIAMHRAVNGLNIKPQLLLVDGIRYSPQFFEKYVCIKKGDSKFLSIAAASILAKDYRDKLMIKMSEKYPDYQWSQNKGYPTKKHKEAIAQYGTTKFHRLSFNHAL